MKQHELVLSWVRAFGSILPAKMSGRIWNDTMFGSETSKRCRELRKQGKLRSEKEGKFERFYLVEAPIVKEEQVVFKKADELIGQAMLFSDDVEF